MLFIGVALIQTIHISKTEGSATDVVERDTVYVRVAMAKAGMRMFVDAPLFGVGYLQAGKRFSLYFETVGSSVVPDEGFLIHNTLVNVLVELGIVGFVPFVLIGVLVIRDAVKLHKHSANNRDIATLFLAACAAVIAAGMANNMYYVFAQVLLFSMAGMVKAKWETRERLAESVQLERWKGSHA
jgi:O-antigen ligase